MRKPIFIVVMLMLAGCNFSTTPQGGATPTIEAIAVTTQAPATATIAPSVTPSPQPIVESPTPTDTALPPTDVPPPTQTPGPIQHTIKAGETLGYIIQLYGYKDFSTKPGSIISEIVRINPNVPNADTLPGPGNVILIPQPTSTATPANDATAVSFAATSAASNPVVTLPANGGVFQYVIQPGDTIVGIAQDNNTTLEVIARMNPELNFFSCNFNIPSGGKDCNVPLRVGQALNLPAPTPTPTLSPTPSGSETPTFTPTYQAPMLIYPPQDAQAQAGVFSLQWVSVGVLRADEYYLVEVQDMTSNAPVFRTITKDTSVLLPDSLIPTDGKPHSFNWTVRVARRNEQGVYGPLGGSPEIRRFQWLSR
jgi:LysM repeat protein